MPDGLPVGMAERQPKTGSLPGPERPGAETDDCSRHRSGPSMLNIIRRLSTLTGHSSASSFGSAHKRSSLSSVIGKSRMRFPVA